MNVNHPGCDGLRRYRTCLPAASSNHVTCPVTQLEVVSVSLSANIHALLQFCVCLQCNAQALISFFATGTLGYCRRLAVKLSDYAKNHNHTTHRYTGIDGPFPRIRADAACLIRARLWEEICEEHEEDGQAEREHVVRRFSSKVHGSATRLQSVSLFLLVTNDENEEQQT